MSPGRWHGGLVVVAAVGVVATAGVLALAPEEDRPAPPTASPTTLPGTSPAERLTWAPPTLEDPKTVRAVSGDSTLVLEDGQDYVVRLPRDQPLVASGGLSITGGEDVVLVGGEIRAPEEEEEGLDRRGLYLKEQTGTVHVEGVRLTGPLSEGINLSQPEGATVQLQNVIIDEVRGERDGHHADLLQTWAGPARLRVDGLTGRSDYQGMFLAPMEFGEEEPQEFDLRRLRIAGVDSHGYMLWGPDDAPYLEVTDSEVTVERDRGRDLIFEPQDAWEDVDVVDDFSGGMPAGEPGLGYVSPGYVEAP